MKLTFVIVGTLIEFSMVAEPYDSYTALTKMTYQSNEYEVKLYSETDTELVFHLYLIHKKPEIKQIISDDTLKGITDTTSHLADTLRYSIGWGYQNFYTGEIDLNPKQLDKHQLQQQLNQAIKDENYELCAKLRDKIKQL